MHLQLIDSTCLPIVRRSRVTVHRGQVVGLALGPVDAGDVEELLPGTLHGVQGRGIARATVTAVGG